MIHAFYDSEILPHGVPNLSCDSSEDSEALDLKVSTTTMILPVNLIAMSDPCRTRCNLSIMCEILH
jgi:hypothetical protein